MTLSADDRFAITDLINMHGHLMDRGDFDGAEALFAADVVDDVSAFGAGSVTYDDTVHRTPEGRRITHRVVRPRRVPLQA